MIEGKIEAGVIKKSATCIMMPNHVEVTCTAIYGKSLDFLEKSVINLDEGETEDETNVASAGEQCRIRLRGVEEEDILPGELQ